MKLIRMYFLVPAPLLLLGCAGSDKDDPQPTNCLDAPSISIASITGASSCKSPDGSIVVTASGGNAPFKFSIDGINFIQANEFKGLAPGIYNIIVQDAEGCTGSVQGTIEAGDSDLAATAESTRDTKCFANNGTITVTTSGGQPPYQYNIGDGFSTNNTFNALPPGSYEVVTQDAEGCSISITANVARGDTGTSYVADVDPIIMANCAIDGCHNGDNGANQDWTNFSLLQSKAEAIKTRTQNGSMPPAKSISEEEKALIACWVDEGAKDN